MVMYLEKYIYQETIPHIYIYMKMVMGNWMVIYEKIPLIDFYRENMIIIRKSHDGIWPSYGKMRCAALY